MPLIYQDYKGLFTMIISHFADLLLRHNFGTRRIDIYPRPDGFSTVVFQRALFGSTVMDALRTYDLRNPGAWFGLPRGYTPEMLHSFERRDLRQWYQREYHVKFINELAETAGSSPAPATR